MYSKVLLTRSLYVHFAILLPAHPQALKITPQDPDFTKYLSLF